VANACESQPILCQTDVTNGPASPSVPCKSSGIQPCDSSHDRRHSALKGEPHQIISRAPPHILTISHCHACACGQRLLATTRLPSAVVTLGLTPLGVPLGVTKGFPPQPSYGTCPVHPLSHWCTGNVATSTPGRPSALKCAAKAASTMPALYTKGLGVAVMQSYKFAHDGQYRS